MKKIMLLLSFALLFSCVEKEEDIWTKTISDYHQNFFGVKLDFNFKMHEIEKVKDILVKDSLDFCKQKIDEAISEQQKVFERSKRDYLEFIKEYSEFMELDYFSSSAHYELYEEDSLRLEQLKNGEVPEGYYKHEAKELRNIFNTMRKFKNSPSDSIISIIVRYRYSEDIPKDIPFVGGGKIENEEDTCILSSDGKKYLK